MEFFIDNVYTVILMPLWIAMLILAGKLFGLIKSRKIAGILSLASALYVLVFSIGIFLKTVVTKGFIYTSSIPFIEISDFKFDIGVFIDGTSAWVLLLVAIVSLFVEIYSYSFMHNDKSFMRYFAFINLFCFSMNGLVLSTNLFQMYMFWELVGLVSYLLIGFWYKQNEVQIAAKKAFIINRIGDFSFLAGIIMSAYIIVTNLANIRCVALPFAEMPQISAQIYGCTSDGIFILTCILLLMGAIAKSAQFPLNTWLIDAMKGPTPVSALIHSATMVAAGVFLIVRLYPLFSLNTVILTIISIIGITTAILCSFSALTQVDIKKILAYSTNAQLGLMFLAVGSCSTTVALFHLTAHALIKAMLFLVAGIVIVALNGNKDIRYAGGLRKYLPTSAISFLIGILSLSGLLFCGFSSKELILGSLIDGKHYVYAVLFIIVAIMTAFYLFRMYFYIFEGKENFENEIMPADINMNIITGLFAIMIILLWFALPKGHNFLFVSISYVSAFIGIFIAYLIFANNNLLKRIPLIYDISYNSLYQEGFNKIVVNCYDRLCRVSYLIDKYIIDGFVYMCTLCTRLCSWFLQKMQTGNVQSYLSYSLFILMLCFGGIIFVYSLIMYLSEVQ